ncbi:MAG: hypothetical protein IGS50_11920 [Synechococcales cyanobacterium C42_A2020_086]|nr:hypothetical protein [Synechococcales cyanobacterium C42_A2020_086]
MVRGHINPSSAPQPFYPRVSRRLRRQTNRVGHSAEFLEPPPQPSQDRPTPVPKPTAASSANQTTAPSEIDLSEIDRDALPQATVIPPRSATCPQSSVSPMRTPEKPWRWSLVGIGTLAVFGTIGLTAYLWLSGLPPLPDCEKISLLSPETQRLYCAQDVARSGKLSDLLKGIKMLEPLTADHPLYQEAQQSIAKWSRLVLLLAQEKINQSDLQGAIDAANQIPKTSPVYEEAQQAIANWQQQWQAGEALYAKALEAVKQQDWKLAFEQVAEMGYLEQDYWRLQQADVLSKQILLQKQSRERLTQAQKLAKGNSPEKLGEAIELAMQVAPGTDAWAEAQTVLQQWGQTLLTTGLQQWQAGEVNAALTTARQIPLHLSLPAAAKDLVTFSHAHQRVAESLQDPQPSWKQVWNLTEAIAAMQQISTDSLVYKEAQVQLQVWQAELEDMTQLQLAAMLAGIGQKPALEAAIERARQVAADRPRQAQAQSLIATWQQKIEQLEDRPYLQRAHQLAAAGQIPNLQQAIAQAQVIPSHRALWSEAQSQIMTWQRQIEILEDQPLWNQAKALADRGKLEEAIQAAAAIRPERALYLEVQASVETWKAKLREIQIAEDQKLLDQARDLASRDRLTLAIEVASQIAPGRALYFEAQGLIGIWLKERDSIWKTWATEDGASMTAPSPGEGIGSEASEASLSEAEPSSSPSEETSESEGTTSEGDVSDAEQ